LIFITSIFKMDKKIINTIIGLLISAITIYFLLGFVNPKEIMIILQNLPIQYVILTFVLYILVIVTRTLRFNFILETKLKIKQLFNIISIHTLLISVLPLRLGDFSYIYFMKKKGVHISKGLSQLLIVRVYDVFAISLIFLVSTFFVKDAPDIVNHYVKFIIIFLVLLIGGFIVFLKFDNKLIRLLKKLNPIKIELVDKFFSTIHELVKNFKKSWKFKTASVLFAQSLFIWILNFVMTFYLFKGFGLLFNFWEISLIFTFLIILIMLPIASFSGFGVWEGGLTGAFTAFGMGLENAVASSFAYHLISLFFIVLIGIYGLVGHYIIDR